MARNTRSKTRRARVQTIQGDTVAVQPRTPLTATARSNGADAAFALASALKVGGTLQESRDIKKTQQAQADFERGEVDEQERNRAYRRSVETLKAKARWVEDEAEFDERLKDIDLNDITLDELQDTINGWYSEKYGDLEDPQVSAGVLQSMGSYRADVISRAIEIQQEAERAEIGTSLKSLGEAAYDPEEPGVFDYEGFNREIQAVWKGAVGNETYFEIISDIAIRNGDVDLIRNAPDRWPDGTPTYTGNPDNADAVRAAEEAAIAQRARIDKKLAEDLENAEKEEHRQLTVAAAIKAVNGLPFEDELLALIGNTETKYTDVTGLEAARRAGLSERESRSWDERTVTKYWSMIANGEMTVMDVVNAHDEGYLGYGPQSSKLAESMIRMADQHQRAKSNDTTGTFQNYRTLLNNRYNKQQDGPLAPVDPKMAPLNVEANELYLRLQVDESLSPREAYDRVVEQFDPVADRIKAGISDAGSQASQATILGLAVNRQEIDAYLSDDLSLIDFMGSRSPEEFLIQIGNSGADQETLDAIADKYLVDFAALEAAQQQ